MWLLALFIVLVVITSKRKRELSAFVTEKKKKIALNVRRQIGSLRAARSGIVIHSNILEVGRKPLKRVEISCQSLFS